MSLLERYIGKHQLFGTFLVLAILVFLMGFMDLERELSDLGERDYGLGPMFSYVALRLPHFAYQILPVAALIGRRKLMRSSTNSKTSLARTT